VSQNLINIIIK
jgi:hypothetical protein